MPGEGCAEGDPGAPGPIKIYTAWADRKGPKIYPFALFFYLFSTDTQNDSLPTHGLRFGLRGLFRVQLALFFEPIRSRGFRGLRGPRRAENPPESPWSDSFVNPP